MGNPPSLELKNNILNDSIRSFVQGPSSGLEESLSLNEDYKCILLAQRLVEKELDNGLFQSFLHSESYFKWASEVQKKQLSNSEIQSNDGNYSNNNDFSSPFKRSFENDQALTSGFASGDESRENESNDKETNVSMLLNKVFLEIETCGKSLVIFMQNLKLFLALKVTAHQSKVFETGKTVSNTELIGEIMTVDLNSLNWEGSNENRKDIYVLDDEQDFHSPYELLVQVNKLQRTKEEIDKVLLQMECMTLLASMVQERNQFGSPRAAMQLNIIEKTKDLMRNDIGDLTRQKTRLESQEIRDAIVPGQCQVKIFETFEGGAPDMDDRSKGGRNLTTYYSIKIQKLDHPGWSVIKSYNEFEKIHRALREKHGWMNDLELPGKAGIFNRRAEQKPDRMMELEKYLHCLLDNEKVCQSEELRSFLSTSSNPTWRKTREFNEELSTLGDTSSKKNSKLPRIINIKRTLSSNPPNNKFQSFKDSKQQKQNQQRPISPFSGEESDLENVSPTILISKSSTHLITGAPEIASTRQSQQSDLVAMDEDNDLDDEDELLEDSALDPEDSEPVQFQSNPLAEPLCSIVLEIFEFKEQNSWLRRNTAVLLLKNWFGGNDSLGRLFFFKNLTSTF
ncbi:Intermediate filament protein [Nowakowskiella sp. JEL0078]|nr:Intermediate filament protein [Nowakowskiella sp. JEL0078]